MISGAKNVNFFVNIVVSAPKNYNQPSLETETALNMKNSYTTVSKTQI